MHATRLDLGGRGEVEVGWEGEGGGEGGNG